MTTHTEDGGAYVSTEPCHWGMVKIPAAPTINWLEGLRAYQKPFEPFPWHEARVKEEA